MLPFVFMSWLASNRWDILFHLLGHLFSHVWTSSISCWDILRTSFHQLGHPAFPVGTSSRLLLHLVGLTLSPVGTSSISCWDILRTSSFTYWDILYFLLGHLWDFFTWCWDILFHLLGLPLSPVGTSSFTCWDIHLPSGLLPLSKKYTITNVNNIHVKKRPVI